MTPIRCWSALVILGILSVCQELLLAQGGTIDFNRDIRPILSQKCLKCHGFDGEVRQGGVRLDTREGAITPGDSGEAPIVPGDSAVGTLLARVTSRDPDHRMPPADTGPPLSDERIQRLRDWIDQGARWQKHWSFEQARQPQPAAVPQVDWLRNPIDVFLLEGMKKAEVEPSREADRHTLIRRLYLDLLGILPTPEDLQRAALDRAPDWYERLLDRLLANPHYGERMGRNWLDAARYADSSGYANDDPRSIWPYRDWVVRSLNADIPFDRFTIDQIAGDLLPQPTDDQIIATGFHRNTPHQYEGGSDPEQYRVDRVKNRVDTTGSVWLGLTLGCAQCHTHKYDPISHSEYYQFYAFFNADEEPEEWQAHSQDRAEIAQLQDRVAQLSAMLTTAQDGERESIQQEINMTTAALEKTKRGATRTLVLQMSDSPRATHIHQRGSFLSPGEAVSPAPLAALHPFHAPKNQLPNRLHLAQWLAASDNPLTARVMVNRMWQHFFGVGLVETENDFGSQGALPSHPELLDWLAVRFHQNGWSMKAMHRQIVMSAGYRQSSEFRADLLQKDPQNRLFARQSRHRVEAEVVRDIALAASGLLTPIMGGPGVFPPVPPNVMGTSSAGHKWPTSDGANRFRRAIYTTVYRAEIYPLLSTFDGPDRDNACTHRNRSNTPLQSLTLANDPAMFELSQGLGARIFAEGGANDADRVRTGFMLCLGRSPSDQERDVLIQHYGHQLHHYRQNATAAKVAMGPFFPPDASPPDAAACVALGRVLINLDNFVTRE
ncbi:MAG: PSD1 and planctomycete cytochrome C domain-containing protein [Planctomycetota bacterium]|nr:PSD1 and planctomycete cytochrome C domain-containing protein [Planctomycetota bacterium]